MSTFAWNFYEGLNCHFTKKKIVYFNKLYFLLLLNFIAFVVISTVLRNVRTFPFQKSYCFST